MELYKNGFEPCFIRWRQRRSTLKCSVIANPEREEIHKAWSYKILTRTKFQL